MHRSNARVIESNIPAAAAPTPKQFGAGNYTTKQRREFDDVTAWLEDQDDAEREFLIAEVAAKNLRAGRRSMGY